MVRAGVMRAVRARVVWTDIAAATIPAIAIPEPGADKADFFGLRAGNADGGIQRHGFSAANCERASSGESSHRDRSKNKTTHSNSLLNELKTTR
jgi:hypothetical protein